jgi:hypothetical protein
MCVDIYVVPTVENTAKAPPGTAPSRISRLPSLAVGFAPSGRSPAQGESFVLA